MRRPGIITVLFLAALVFLVVRHYRNGALEAYAARDRAISDYQNMQQAAVACSHATAKLASELDAKQRTLQLVEKDEIRRMHKSASEAALIAKNVNDKRSCSDAVDGFISAYTGRSQPLR